MTSWLARAREHHPSTASARRRSRPARFARSSRALACALACFIGGCAASTPARETVRPVDSSPLPLSDDAFACVRHSDCTVANGLRVVLFEEDCHREPLRMLAVRVDTLQALGAAVQRICPPPPHPCECGDGRPPTCCPPMMEPMMEPMEPMPTPLHASCVRSRCAILEGWELSDEERREEAEGRGTDDPGQCSRDQDCAERGAFTAFPDGIVDAAGRYPCPVCPRLGAPLPDEAAHVAAWASYCPPLACLPTSVGCDHRRCVLTPERPPRAPAFALFEPAVAEPLALPSGPDYACTSTAECVLAPALGCYCNRGVEPVHRRAAAQRRSVEHAHRCLGMPCRPRPGEPPPRVRPVCASGVCTSADMVAGVRASRREHAQQLRAHREWEREVARLRAAPGEIEPGAEE